MAPGKVVLITGGYDHTIRFWEVQSGSCFRTLQYPDSPINLLRVSPDKRWLAVCGNPHCRLYSNDQASSTHAHQFDGHTTNVTGVVFSPDGAAMFTSSEDSTVKGWDLRTNQSTMQLSCSHAVNAVAMRPTGWLLVSGDQGGNVRVWDLRKTSHCLREMVPEGDSAIRSVSFAPDDSVLVACNNAGSFYVWKVSTPNLPPQRPAAPGRSSQEAAGDGAGARGDVVGQNGSHDAGTGESNGAPAHKGSRESDEDWDGSEGEGGDENDDTYDEEDEEDDDAEDDSPAEGPRDAAGEGVGDVLGVGRLNGGEVALDPVKHVAAHNTYILRSQISPDSRLLATTSADQTVKIWSVGSDQESYQLQQTLHGHQRWVWDLDFSADSQFLVTGSSDNTARSWNVAQPETICVFNGHPKAVISVALWDARS